LQLLKPHLVLRPLQDDHPWEQQQHTPHTMLVLAHQHLHLAHPTTLAALVISTYNL
jgi:hypothetical protein